MADRTAIRRMMTAALAAGALAVAGCGGSAAEETGSGLIPESGTLPPTTTTTAPPGTSEETTTTQVAVPPTITLPSGVQVVVVIEVQRGEASVSSVVSGNDPSSDRTVQVGVNTPVEIQVTSDQPDQVHVHGYNLLADVRPGVTGTVRFVADAPGLFLIELEQSHLLLARLEVVS